MDLRGGNKRLGALRKQGAGGRNPGGVDEFLAKEKEE